jgi:hypothetical protein
MYISPPSGSSTIKLNIIGMSPATFGLGMLEFSTSSSTTRFANPTLWASGTWTVTKIIATDVAGNIATYESVALTGIAAGGATTITVTQSTAPTTVLINPVGLLISPTTIDISASGASAQVTYNVTVDGTFSLTSGVSITLLLAAPDSRCDTVSLQSFQFVEVVGTTTVYRQRATYFTGDLCNGAHNAAVIRTKDNRGSTVVAGTCPSGSTSTCQDPRVDPASSAANLQASIMVILAAVVAALFA